MKHILRRSDGWGPAYVRSGGKTSYTNRRSCATVYDSFEEAQENACGNEYPVEYPEYYQR